MRVNKQQDNNRTTALERQNRILSFEVRKGYMYLQLEKKVKYWRWVPATNVFNIDMITY